MPRSRSQPETVECSSRRLCLGPLLLPFLLFLSYVTRMLHSTPPHPGRRRKLAMFELSSTQRSDHSPSLRSAGLHRLFASCSVFDPYGTPPAASASSFLVQETRESKRKKGLKPSAFRLRMGKLRSLACIQSPRIQPFQTPKEGLKLQEAVPFSHDHSSQLSLKNDDRAAPKFGKAAGRRAKVTATDFRKPCQTQVSLNASPFLLHVQKMENSLHRV